MRSAWERSSHSRYPSDVSMPFIRSESCSFIWHPKVVTWKDLPLTEADCRYGAGSVGYWELTDSEM